MFLHGLSAIKHAEKREIHKLEVKHMNLKGEF